MTSNQQHPITPPPELVQEWREEASHRQYSISETDAHLIEQAAQYGADQELEACCEWLGKRRGWEDISVPLRAARRPKPPSLKERALKALKYAPGPDYPNPITLLTADEHALIRRALESLPN
jgi:hypothetical protein